MSEKIQAVLYCKTSGLNGVCGQTIGADGAGKFIRIFKSDNEEDSVKAARSFVDRMRVAGFKIDYVDIVLSSDMWCNKSSIGTGEFE